jgi:hypothetical protein
MTGQDLLDRMELVNAELQLQAGEEDVTKGLLALNVAQDYFETVAAQRAKIFGSATGTVTTTASTETTAFPAGLLRIDRLQLLDANSYPVSDLQPLRRTGGHAVSYGWFASLVSPSSTGVPTRYWTNGTNIYWAPLPSGTSTVRWYGFQRAANITAAGTFAYDDGAAFPIAVFAAQLIKLGLDDDPKDLSSLAVEVFSQVLDQLSLGNRDGAVGMEYTQIHTE